MNYSFKKQTIVITESLSHTYSNWHLTSPLTCATYGMATPAAVQQDHTHASNHVPAYNHWCSVGLLLVTVFMFGTHATVAAAGAAAAAAGIVGFDWR